jgi:hypothetical protein
MEADLTQRSSRPIAMIQLLDDGSLRLLPIATSETEIVEIQRVLGPVIKAVEDTQ